MFTRICKSLLLNIRHRKQCRAIIRSLASNITARRLIYSEYGDPLKVISLETFTLSQQLNPNEVLVEMLASPVNPADINTIQGTYAIKPPLPSVPGNEGVGRVVGVGDGVRCLQPDDYVVPKINALGTFTSHVKMSQDHLIKVDSTLSVPILATLMVNPATAYRMLHDYVSLSPGMCVIQNGANGHVGQAVVQICKKLGVTTVNIVRERDDLESLKDYLKSLGADYVLTEQQLRTTDVFKSGEIARPVLGLNCVGGRSTVEIIRHLAAKGTLVTYGGMSKQPIPLGVAPLVFKDVTLRGFWMTRWNQEHLDTPERSHMVNYLLNLAKDGGLVPPKSKMVDLEEYKEALTGAMTGFSGHKYIFKF